MSSWEATITGDSEVGIVPLISIDHLAPGEWWALLHAHNAPGAAEPGCITLCLGRDEWQALRAAVTTVWDRMNADPVSSSNVDPA